MIPASCNIPAQDPSSQSPLPNVPTQSPAPTTLPDPESASPSVLSTPYSPGAEVPPRPSTAPPHPASAASKNNASQVDPQSRTTLVSNLRARNLLLQKAISHIDDAVLHLMAARSGIPNSKIQQVRGEARNRKDLLDRLDRAIEMARNGELLDETHGEVTTSGVGDTRPSTESLAMHPLGNPPQTSGASSDTPQLRRSSSQPQLGPSTTQTQVPTKVYTLLELLERRNVLQESIESWQNFITELRAAQPHLTETVRGPLPDVVSTPLIQTQEASWTEKYQRAQFEIKRREDLLLRLNQAIAQVSQTHPTAEQFTALATYMPPPLDKPRFDAAYAHYCQGRSIPMNTNIIMPDLNKPVIEIYSLHVAVMHEGSFARVSARKSWDAVGGRLGFVQTAATSTATARCSPEIAVHLEKVYKDRLQHFDHLYVSSVIETVRKRMAEQQKKS